MDNKLIKATVCILALLGAMVLLAVLKRKENNNEKQSKSIGENNQRYFNTATGGSYGYDLLGLHETG